MPNALVTKNLTIRYGATVALEDCTLEIPAGASVALLGPNGSGKSTFLNAAAGIAEPASGSIVVNTERVGYMPQHLSLEPTFPVTVADVVEMGRWGRRGWLRPLDPSDRAAALGAIEQLGLQEVAGRRFSALSGGQRQRALLAQIVAQESELMLLDEPLSGVDRPTAVMIAQLTAHWRDQGRTVIVATHDLEAAAREYDLVVALNRRVIAFGPPRVVCTEPILRETFSGHVARVGNEVIDTSHHHHDAG